MTKDQRRHIMNQLRNSRDNMELNIKFYDTATAAYFLGFETKTLYDFVHHRYSICRTISYNQYKLLNKWILLYSADRIQKIK